MISRDARFEVSFSVREASINLRVSREPNDGHWSDVWINKPFSAVSCCGRPVGDLMFSTAYQCGASWNDSFWCHDRFEDLLLRARA